MDLENDGWIDRCVPRSNVLDNIQDYHEGGTYPARRESCGTSRPMRTTGYCCSLSVRAARMEVGAQVQLVAADGRWQWNEASTSVGCASSSDSRVHFGLGGNAVVRGLEVRWPSRTRQLWHGIKADRILVINER
jgi:hypothetical protein